MSDVPQGPDWWKATDGKWYLPPATSDSSPPETRAPATNPRRAIVWVIGIAIAIAIGLAMSKGGDSDQAGPDKYGAFDVCKTFVKEQLRAPGTASFPNPYQDDGEVTWSGGGDHWTVGAFVDAENGFGGEVRTPFACEVEFVSGTRWHLVNLSMSDQ